MTTTIVKKDDLVYHRHDLLAVPLDIKKQIMLESHIPADYARRLRIINRIESLFSPNPVGIENMYMDEYSEYCIMEILSETIKASVPKYFNKSTHPWVCRIRIPLAMNKIYILVRTTYGTRACVNNFVKEDTHKNFRQHRGRTVV